jgi:uncharacterized damage-inducible protein DinB
MNSLMTESYPILEMYQALRTQLMEVLTDDDLSYTPGGANPTLGALCREMGEVEHAYVESFKTFKMDFSYQNPEPGLEQSVSRLAAWYAELDPALKAAVEALLEEAIQERTVDRGEFKPPLRTQLFVYQEALLIFYGKVMVYLRGKGIAIPPQWAEWIG